MNWSDLNLMPALPEVALLSLLVLLLPADLWASDDKCRWTHYGALATVAVTAAVQLAVWEQGSTSSFNGMYIADGMSRLAKMVLYALTFVLFVYAKPYNQVRGIFKGEFYTLSLFALLGMSVMVSAGHFLTAYIGLELLSLALYALIALRRDSGFAAEAALKYFVLGALASGLLLYGISMVYGATGSLEFAGVLASSFNEEANEWLLKLGLVFIVVAVAFKLGAVPFHMWMPDVYHGAPTSVTALVGTAPKIAAVVFAFRILVTGLGTVHHDWSLMFALLAAASLLVGNLAAIMQTNIKRMLAYSTVSHMGFILLAFMAARSALRRPLLRHYLRADGGGRVRRVDGVVGRGQRVRKHQRFGRVEPTPRMACLFDAAGYVLYGGHSAADGFLRQIRRYYGAFETRLCMVVGVCRRDVAGWRVLLPARGQSHVF